MLNAIDAIAPGLIVILELEHAVRVPSLAPILNVFVFKVFKELKVAIPLPKVTGFAAFLSGLEEETSITEAGKQAQIRRTIEAQMPTEMKETFHALSIMKSLENDHVFALMPYQISIR